MKIEKLLVQHQEGNLSFTDTVALFFMIWPEKKKALESFFEHEDQFSWKKLNEEINKKIAEQELKQPNESFKSFAPSKHLSNPIRVELLPDELRLEYNNRPPLFRRRAQLHARLVHLDNPELTKAAAEIVDLSAQIFAIHTKVDTFFETGEVLKNQTEKPAPIDPTALKDHKIEYDLKLLRARRSKAKSNPAKLQEFNLLDKQIKELEGKRYV